ncbi:MAG: FMN-binding protein [Candidatus Dormibacteria bacterium]
MHLRAIITMVGTALAVVLILNFKTPDLTNLRPRTAADQVALVSPAPSDQPSPDASSPASPSPSPTPSGSGYRNGTYTGTDFPNQFGDVQVKVTVSGGRITDVVGVQMPSDRARSAYITQVAGPMLHDEVLQAQSANIDLISGATYTSDSYARSVQSALDQAHA